ncbi:hypothetical protein RB195_001357 [Necator americanus]|uniref:DUF4605 domain-containing protein n=1 Tax=Necator americanus TaxID=51031 RepID=A0ABR1DEL5_NECAM
MVRVLSNGEVVADDDPRAFRQRSSAPRSQPATPTYHQPQTQATSTDGFSSLWNNANDRLRQFGLDSFHVAGYRVDPLHLVVAVLGFLLSGPMMLAIVVAAIVISQSSSDNTAPTPFTGTRNNESSRTGDSSYFAQGDGPRQSTGSKDSGAFSGAGQRLGN